MRSTDAAGAAAAVLALSMLAGCGTFGSVAPTGAPPAAAAAAPATRPSDAVNGAAATSLVAVDAATRQRFDAALRAMAAGRRDEAQRLLEPMAQAHPELGGVQANLGLLYREAGKLPEAAGAFERAVQANPRQPAYRNQLGITYRQMGRFDDARAAYEAALAIDPRQGEALLNLAILNDIYLWNGERALELYERYLALAPGGDAVVAKWVADLKHRMSGAGRAGAKEAG